MKNFKLNQAVRSITYGIGVVVFENSDNSIRVEFSSGLRPVYWQDGSEYNPDNERDFIVPFFTNYLPQK